MFTARNRQNAFAKRRREVRAAREAEAAPKTEPAAVPYDTRNEDSTDIVNAPDVSTFATGGVVPLPEDSEPEETVIETGEHIVPLHGLSEETMAKVEAVVNHAVPPVAAVPTEPQTPLEGSQPVINHDPKRGRGRPRPQETIDRDNAVHALLVEADAEGITKELIASELGEKEQQIYSSLRQLKKEGRAETRYVKPHGYRWFAL